MWTLGRDESELIPDSLVKDQEQLWLPWCALCEVGPRTAPPGGVVSVWMSWCRGAGHGGQVRVWSAAGCSVFLVPARLAVFFNVRAFD